VDVAITEVADKGSSGACAGEDWVEIHNSGGTAADLTNYTLHDDNGPGHANALTFAGTTIAAGEYLLQCRNADFAFGIGGDDTVSLRDASGQMLSTTGQLGDSGAFNTTWALDGETWGYTIVATPGAANTHTPPADLLGYEAQNALGTDFFGVNDDGTSTSTYTQRTSTSPSHAYPTR
jgi:hypothetical protein